MACHLATERVWVDKSKYNDAEKNYFEQISKLQGSINKNNEKKEKSTIVEDKCQNTQCPTSVEECNPKTMTLSKKKNKKSKINCGILLGSIDNIKKTSESSEKEVNIIENNELVGDDNKSKNKKKNKKKAVVVNEIKPDKLHDKINIQDQEFQLSEIDQDKEKKTKTNIKNKGTGTNQCTLVSEIAKARQHIKNSLERMDGIAALAASPGSNDVLERLCAIERENLRLHELLNKYSSEMVQRLNSIEEKMASLNIQTGNAPSSSNTQKQDDDDDDGVDLFGSDSEGEDEEAAKVREARLAAYAAKKSTKPAIIAKSSLVLDVKPWDDETDLKIMETEIRKIKCDGLLWGASKFMPVAFGIQKLSISCVVEDEKVSIDWLTEEIEKFEDFVQSVDVAAFNKI